jgi:hypothetical protein
MNYPRSKFQMPSSNVTLFITIKPGVKYRSTFHAVAMLYHILKVCIDKLHLFRIPTKHTLFLGPLCYPNSSAMSQVCVSAMLLLSVLGN